MATHSNELGGSELKFRTEPRNGGTWIALTGNITEQAKYEALKRLPGPLVIDLAGVDRINSLGVRGWIDFIAEREAAGVALAFERCPPVIIGQVSMISNFMGRHGQVRSMSVPYLCLTDNTDKLELVDIKPGAVLPAPVCPKCGARMVVDDLEEAYVRLLG